MYINLPVSFLAQYRSAITITMAVHIKISTTIVTDIEMLITGWRDANVE